MLVIGDNLLTGMIMRPLWLRKGGLTAGRATSARREITFMYDDQNIASLNSNENQTRRRGQAEPSGMPIIADHPRRMDGLVSQFEHSRDELMKLRQTAITCVETAIARLHSLDRGSISGTAREMAVELDAALHELNSFDPDARPEPEHFFAIAGGSNHIARPSPIGLQAVTRSRLGDRPR